MAIHATDEYDHHHREMTQTDLALTSAIKAIIQIFLRVGIAQPKTIEVYFNPMIDRYFQQGDLKAAKSILLASGAQLARILMEQKSSSDQVPVHTFEEFAETISTLSSSRSLLYSSVALCHPSHPDPTPFIHYVDSLSPSKFQKWNETRRDAFLRISCDALRTLIDRKKIRLATSLGHQIQELLPEETATASVENSRSKASSEEDHLLQRLELNWT